MSKLFGKTWWGEQWLKSLSNIDYSNRLSRGSAYARNGSILYIHINGNCIEAKVRGSDTVIRRGKKKRKVPSLYDVSITIPNFFETEIQELVKAVAEKPMSVSKLLNCELDPELLEVAEAGGLQVFPKQWSDFEMKCNCEDYAVPCKHLAAVIYKISTEIDNNPLLIFSLRGVDLKGELEKQNIFVETAGSAIPVLKQLVLEEIESGKLKIESEKAESSEVPHSPSLIHHSSLNLTEPLIHLLMDAPVYYQGKGDFKEKYSATLRKVVRNMQRLISGKSSVQDYFGKLDTETDGRRKKYGMPLYSVTHHTNLQLAIDANNQPSIWIDKRKQHYTLKQLILLLWQIPMSKLKDYQPTVEACKTSLLIAANLLANGAVVPQIVQLDNKSYTMRIVPALISKEVKALVKKLQETLPPDILLFAESQYTYDLGKDHVPVKDKLAFTLLSIWLKALVSELSQISKGDLFTTFFFTNHSHSFYGPGEKSLPGGIQTWLQPYHLTQGNYKPVVVVKEMKNDRFRIAVNIQQNNRPFKKPITLRRVFSQKAYERHRFKILQSLSQLNCFIPGLDNYINTKGESIITMDMATFTPFLMQAIPAIQLLDIEILLPKSLQQILKPKPSIRIRQKGKESQSFMRLDHLLDFDWQVAIGDTVLAQDDFNKLLKNSEGLIRYKSSYIYVSHNDLEKLHKHFAASKVPTPFEMLRAALSDDYYGASVELTNDVRQLIKELTEQKSIPLPKGINATLRPYQERGYSWLYRNSKTGFGSVIADDMGLGKTIQVITTLLKYKEEGALEKEKALVIAPTGVLTNWQAEIEKFAPSLRFRIYHGMSRELDMQDYDVLITSYGIARRDADKLKLLKWFMVITDEAQNIKNHDTAQSKAIKSIPSKTFVAMSGTPVENRLSELWSIMDFSNRGFLGTLPDFREHFASPIQNQNDVAVAQKLKTITAPFLMRRMKNDKTIISDLPDKIEIDSFCHLVKEQASLYQQTLRKAMDAIESIEPVSQQALFARQGLVLQMILALKQICNHPTHFLKNNIQDASLSGKMELLFDKLDSIMESDEKVLIFTQFTEMASLLQHFITERFGETPLYYHGGCTLNERTEMVERFQTNRADKIFILSLKAAGTGLNLTAATHVIHYDLWWNPAVESQATDRAYRIGQKSNVMVHRLITKGTFEERINEMIQSKKALANLTVATGENWIGNMSNKELKEIFELK